MTYPTSVVEQAQVLHLAGHSLRGIVAELNMADPPSYRTICNWIMDIPESARIKYREYQHRLTFKAQSLLELKLDEALEDPSSVNLATANATSGTQVDKEHVADRLDQDRAVNTALEFWAQVAERARQLQLEHDKHPDALWSLAAPKESVSES